VPLVGQEGRIRLCGPAGAKDTGSLGKGEIAKAGARKGVATDD